MKNWLIGKDPDAGIDWKQEEKGRQRMRWLDGIIDLLRMRLSKFWEIVQDREAWHAAVQRSQRVGQNWATEQQNFSFTTYVGVIYQKKLI